MKATIITGKTKAMKNPMILGILLIILVTGCHNVQEKEVTASPKAIVEAVTFKSGSISEEVNFQAQSGYQIKNRILAPIDCYVQKAFTMPGDKVQAGQILYEIVTKEGKATEHLKDTIYNNLGIIQIKANSPGIVSSVQTQTGDFVSAGNQMCEISNVNSLVFTLQVPVEYSSLIRPGALCQITFPGGNTVPGIMKNELGQMSLNGQTRQYLVRPSNSAFIPENLLATVKITTQKTASNQILPVSCVLTDEMMQNFWVMKLINDSTAVKINVKTGLKNKNEVEILGPAFSPSDRILSEGNYGLPDTALVNVIKH
jgi:uncharacterized protein YegJ (DUF2314 family)